MRHHSLPTLLRALSWVGHRAGALRRSARRAWQGMQPRTRLWLVYIAVGVSVELLLYWAAHGLELSFVLNTQNAAMDKMMLVQAATRTDGVTGARSPPSLLFVDVDDQTWRDPRWGGGEPARAPRDALATLIDRAFQRGAGQVILDIAIEGATGRDVDLAEDRRFAARMGAMLAAPWFDTERQLVLVRTLRQPLPVQAKLWRARASTQGQFNEGFFDELRESPAVDEVVARSHGRIVLAAPFFTVSPDHVLRDWQLLQVVCARFPSNTLEGVVRVVPSVQLAVAVRHFGLPAGNEPWRVKESRTRCSPLPPNSSPAMTVDQARETSIALQSKADELLGVSWKSTSQALRGAGIVVREDAPRTHDLRNRVVFRWPTAPNALSAIDLLEGQTRHDFKNRVVLIGQTHSDLVDRHVTPLGEMPGAIVLLNAIDSMTRHHFIETPSAWIILPLAFGLIVLVSYVFSRWSSTVSTLIAACAIAAVLLPVSYGYFKHGVWLDLALPILGIQAYQLFKSFEEYLVKRHADLKRTR